MTLVLVVVADVPQPAREAFAAQEAAVLPLLPRHGGRLERRLPTDDEATEVHVVAFEDRAGHDAYRSDPARLAHRAPDGVVQRVLEVREVR